MLGQPQKLVASLRKLQEETFTRSRLGVPNAPTSAAP